ncbi:uncharacterized protein [Panulirus ornatus]|uniref:uncharacterized protein n=1 Tax=Panulirus ornatus TaxID=150431 RepID=UPI003A8BB1CD
MMIKWKLVSVVPVLALLWGHLMTSATATPVCDLPQCQCPLTSGEPQVVCRCLSHEKLNVSSSDLPANASSLAVEGCSVLDISGSLSSLPLRSLTIKGVKDLKIASRGLLHGLLHLSTVAVEDTKIPAIPSFTFSDLENIFSITFKNVEIGTILSEAFSDLRHLGSLKFNNCTVGDIERNAFGRGKNRIANFLLEESEVETVHDSGIWLDDADVLHIDKSRIKRVVKNAIKLNKVFYFYLTRSSVENYEPGGISGSFFTGVMIDNNNLNPVAVGTREPRPLVDLHQSNVRGSAIAPFFHFTSNVITRVAPGHAFFITNPTINVAVPNNVLGECSCTEYRSFLHSLRIILDIYTLNAHQAMINHGACQVDKHIYSIGCPNLVLPLSAGVWPVVVRPPSKDAPSRSTTKPGVQAAETRTDGRSATTAKPQTRKTTQRQLSLRPTPRVPTTTTVNPPTNEQVTTVTPAKENGKLQIKPFAIDRIKTSKNITGRPFHNGKPKATSVIPTSDQSQDPSEASVFPPSVRQPEEQDKPVTKDLLVQSLAKDLNSLDPQTIWNEIYGGVFALRLRKPLPDTFPKSRLTVKFKKAMKPLQWRRLQGGRLAVITPR